MQIDTTMVMTSQDIITRALRATHPDVGAVGMSGMDNSRGELDAVRIGTDMLILHGGEFSGGPTYYVSIRGYIGLGGEFRPTDSEATYYDTSTAAMQALTSFISEATPETSQGGIPSGLGRDGGEPR